MFIETREVIALQRSEIARSRAPETVTDEGCVDRSVAGAITAAMYSDGDDAPDLINAVAHLVFYIAKNHCFTDGNKRAALMALLHSLRVNDLELEADQVEVAALINALANYPRANSGRIGLSGPGCVTPQLRLARVRRLSGLVGAGPSSARA